MSPLRVRLNRAKLVHRLSRAVARMLLEDRPHMALQVSLAWAGWAARTWR